MRVSKTGKALCSRCRRLATGEGNVHRDHGRLAVMVYCNEHAEYVGDFKPLGYYRQFFAHIDEMCERENVHQMQWCNHPMTNERLFFAYIACSLLYEHEWSLDGLRRWLHEIAGQPGCVKFASRIQSAQQSKQQETTVPDGFYQKSDHHLPEPFPESSCVGETTTSEQTPDVDALLALVKDYYAAALLGEKLTDPTYEEEREFQARMIGLIDRTEKPLDLNTSVSETGDERLERHGRQWVTTLAEQRASASMLGY